MEQAKLVYIRTFGCQMNAHDTRRMLEVLSRWGYRQTDAPEQADVILINTCSVREKSRLKVLSALGRLARLKEKRQDLIIGVAGCVAQQEGAGLLASSLHLDLVLGPDHLARLPELLVQARRRRTVEVGFADVESYRFLRADPDALRPGPTALVTIQKGCDNSCAYCIVPLVRGPVACRPAPEVLEEIQDLVCARVREVTLIGQNVNAYRGLDGSPLDFVGLLQQVARIEGLDRLRFTTSHPKDFTPELAGCFASLPNLCPWLHLPLQSGSDRVLRMMNRGYGKEDYLRIVDRVRALCPEIALGTDIIVGFPGEGEADFEQTLRLLEQVQFDYAFSFKYSVRGGTSAEALDDPVAEQVKAERLAVLQQLQDSITLGRLGRLVGHRVHVLVEGPSRRGGEQLCGRTPGNHVVNIEAGPGKVKPGDLVPVLITEARAHSLAGRVQHDPILQ